MKTDNADKCNTSDHIADVSKKVNGEALEAFENIKESIMHEGIDYPFELEQLETIRKALKGE